MRHESPGFVNVDACTETRPLPPCAQLGAEGPGRLAHALARVAAEADRRRLGDEIGARHNQASVIVRAVASNGCWSWEEATAEAATSLACRFHTKKQRLASPSATAVAPPRAAATRPTAATSTPTTRATTRG